VRCTRSMRSPGVATGEGLTKEHSRVESSPAEQTAAADRAGMSAFRGILSPPPARPLSFGVRCAVPGAITMRYPCPQCGRKYDLRGWQLGQEVECPNCQTRFILASQPTWTPEEGPAPPQQVVTHPAEPSPYQPDELPGPGAGMPLSSDNCPECGRVLHPVAQLRPTPSLGWPARLLLVAGAVLSAVAYLAGLVAIRSMIRVPMVVLSLLWFPVALLPALTCGAAAYRFPRVARLGCRGCGWRSKVVMGPGRLLRAEQSAAADRGRDHGEVRYSGCPRGPGG
jgi:DNA-directed RNA polymerase subunit RPC12/RpoP